MGQIQCNRDGAESNITLMKNPEPPCLKGVCKTGRYLFCHYHTLISSRVPGGEGSQEKVVFLKAGVRC